MKLLPLLAGATLVALAGSASAETITIAAVNNGVATGSGRSMPGFDLGAAVIAARHSGLLLTGGVPASALSM